MCSSVRWNSTLDLLLDAGEDVAVDVVDEVERGEEYERGGGSGDGGEARGGFGGGGHHWEDSRVSMFRARSSRNEGSCSGS